MSVIIDWVMSHQIVIVSAVIAVADLVFALVPSWQSNGLLHWVYMMLKKLIPSKPA